MSVARRERILAMINERGSVSLKELEYAFPEVSSMTLRRDLQHLDERGEAIRVRRGARSTRSVGGNGNIEPVYTMRAVENLDAKDRIALRALELLETGRSVFLDAGTTVMRLARALPDTNYSIITQAPNVAIELAKRQHPDVFMLGGRLVKDNLAITGPLALTMLEHFNIDTALMSCSGFSPEAGFTCGNHDEAEVKRTVIRKAHKVIMLMDQTKLDKSLPLTFAKTDEIDILIIDSAEKPSEAALSCIADAGVQLIQA